MPSMAVALLHRIHVFQRGTRKERGHRHAEAFHSCKIFQKGRREGMKVMIHVGQLIRLVVVKCQELAALGMLIYGYV